METQNTERALNIYSIKDRLLSYFMQPFFGPTDNQVLASLAEVINNEESNHAFSKTPQHFEIWKLGSVSEEGNVKEEREFLCDAASLIRPSIRRGGESGDHPHQGAIRGRQGASQGASRPTGTNGRTAPYQAPPEGLPADETRGGSEGVSRQPNG